MTVSETNRMRILLIAVLVVAVAYLAVWRPRAGQVADLQEQRDLMEQELAGLTPIDAEPAQVDGDAEAFAVAVPMTDGLAELLRQLQSIAADAGVEQRTVAANVPAPIAGTTGASIPVTISVSGPRVAALDYVHRLSLLPRLFVVDVVTLEPTTAERDATEAAVAPVDPAEERVQLDITGRVFTTATPATEATNG